MLFYSPYLLTLAGYEIGFPVDPTGNVVSVETELTTGDRVLAFTDGDWWKAEVLEVRADALFACPWGCGAAQGAVRDCDPRGRSLTPRAGVVLRFVDAWDEVRWDSFSIMATKVVAELKAEMLACFAVQFNPGIIISQEFA